MTWMYFFYIQPTLETTCRKEYEEPLARLVPQEMDLERVIECCASGGFRLGLAHRDGPVPPPVGGGVSSPQHRQNHARQHGQHQQADDHAGNQRHPLLVHLLASSSKIFLMAFSALLRGSISSWPHPWQRSLISIPTRRMVHTLLPQGCCFFSSTRWFNRKSTSNFPQSLNGQALRRIH